MQIEQYFDLRAFCQTDSYQQWLQGWQAPIAHPEVDCWYDNEQDMMEWRHHQQTPRQKYLSRDTTRLPFYLLDSLQIGELPCVDIGCGHNWFRQFYPTIWGVDPHSETHRNEPLTPAWYSQNQGRWARAFSCNALHFADPIQVTQNIGRVRGLLRPGGRALIALNRARIQVQERTATYSDAVLQETLLGCPGLTRMVWFESPVSASMDGNVWLWIDPE
jgi:SAM-dependent methyltransferase